MKIKWCLSVSIVLLLTFVPVTSAVAPLMLFVNGQPVISIGSPAVRVMEHTLYVDIHAISSELKLDVDHNEKDNAIFISNIGEPQSEVVVTLKEAKTNLYNMYQSKRIEYLKKRTDFIMESSFQ